MKKLILTAVAVGLLAIGADAAEVNEKACGACHGQDWSKKALGKSLDVSKMSEGDIATALKGYKDGTYGGPMKGLMKGQVAKYSNEELDALATRIAARK